MASFEPTVDPPPPCCSTWPTALWQQFCSLPKRDQVLSKNIDRHDNCLRGLQIRSTVCIVGQMSSKKIERKALTFQLGRTLKTVFRRRQVVFRGVRICGAFQTLYRSNRLPLTTILQFFDHNSPAYVSLPSIIDPCISGVIRGRLVGIQFLVQVDDDCIKKSDDDRVIITASEPAVVG